MSTYDSGDIVSIMIDGQMRQAVVVSVRKSNNGYPDKFNLDVEGKGDAFWAFEHELNYERQ